MLVMKEADLSHRTVQEHKGGGHELLDSDGSRNTEACNKSC